MAAATLKHFVVASALMSAAMTASALTTTSATYSDRELQAMLARSQSAQPSVQQPAQRSPQQAPEAELSSHKTLSIGVSDPGTKLILPWFVADLINAVNQRTSPQDFAKSLRDGI
ncbi:hypothetical protein ACN9M1_18095 [Ralstonia sp. R-29]|uniref:hypothetical protein n=1 Tax=Ralstonia sp. R-29 TaxID=3404059 RepID=UPI003CEBE066